MRGNFFIFKQPTAPIKVNNFNPLDDNGPRVSMQATPKQPSRILDSALQEDANEVSDEILVLDRIHFIDRLRKFLTVSVISYSVVEMWSYGFAPLNGSWLPCDSATDVISYIYLNYNFSYFMGFYFLISGYLVTPSFNKRKIRGFFQHRVLRLMVPVIFYDLLLAPLILIATKIMYFGSSLSITQIYKEYFITYPGIGANPLWFPVALFLFELVYIGCRNIIPVNNFLKTAPSPNPQVATISISMICAVILVLTFTMITFIIRTKVPIGFLEPIVFPAFPLAYFGQYILAYFCGVLSYRLNVLARIPLNFDKICLAISIVWGCVGAEIKHITIAISTDPEITQKIDGGSNFYQFCNSLFEQGFAVWWSIAIITIFKCHFNWSQSRIGNLISVSCYTAYIIHPVFVVIYAILIANWDASLLQKIGAQLPIVLVSSWLIAVACKCIPYAGLVL